MKFIAMIAVLALAGCSVTPRAVTVSDLYEAKLSEMRAENAKLHNNPCFKSMAGSYDHVAGWVKQEYTDHTK